MDDRELLELAAKAAGMHKLTEWSDGIWDHDSPHYGYPALHEAGPGGACGSWNPLTDDGDALRLAVACKIAINPMTVDGLSRDRHETTAGCVKRWMACIEKHGGDPFAATRRAIVRAAAEIGKAM